MFQYIDLGIKFDNNKYNQKLPQFMTKKIVIYHPLCHNLEMWKLLVILVFLDGALNYMFRHNVITNRPNSKGNTYFVSSNIKLTDDMQKE